jgi:hypothetical protein
VARLRDIVIDALDPPALARFWAAALDGYALRPYDRAQREALAARGRTPETDPSVAVDGPGPTLFFQEVSAKKTSRNRIHLDLCATDGQAEVERLRALGASVRDEHDDFTVLLDPEGNEFCLLLRGESPAPSG